MGESWRKVKNEKKRGKKMSRKERGEKTKKRKEVIKGRRMGGGWMTRQSADKKGQNEHGKKPGLP